MQGCPNLSIVPERAERKNSGRFLRYTCCYVAPNTPPGARALLLREGHFDLLRGPERQRLRCFRPPALRAARRRHQRCGAAVGHARAARAKAGRGMSQGEVMDRRRCVFMF